MSFKLTTKTAEVAQRKIPSKTSPCVYSAIITVRNKVLVILAPLLICLTFSHAQAQNEFDIELGGYVKELGQLSFDNEFATVRYDNILHHRI